MNVQPPSSPPTHLLSMPDHRQWQGQPLRRDLVISYLAAASVAAHLLESMIPGIGPWFKPGFANLFTLLAFCIMGLEAAVAVTLIRIFASSLLLGTFLSPTFFLSFAGSLAALLAFMLVRLTSFAFGPVGLSILAALLHMIAQVTVASYLIIGHMGFMKMLPWFLLSSWLTGLTNGLLAYWLLSRLKRWPLHW